VDTQDRRRSDPADVRRRDDPAGNREAAAPNRVVPAATDLPRLPAGPRSGAPVAGGGVPGDPGPGPRAGC
jgi:hypothetical protein